MPDEQRQLLNKLGESGLRTTKARILILNHLAHRHDHPTADGILKSLRLEGTALGPATLYQNLGKLADAGLILRITGPDGLMHFDGKSSAHPHLACISCGQIVDAEVDESLLARLAPICPHTRKPLSSWRLEDVQLELKGVCPDCQRKQ
jgi:Fe2+ or Zn2+ uptake regulation protein